ncbi:MAG: hypothetical protein LWX07_09455 [Bacteroidetes bacterium]|nr:hypothetical protein [Bacteroidota bacterium]
MKNTITVIIALLFVLLHSVVSPAQNDKNKSLEGKDAYFPCTKYAPFTFVRISGIGTETVRLQQFTSDDSKTPNVDITLTKLSDNVYNWHNILENSENKLIVVHPDGMLSLMKVGKDFASYNWTYTLTQKQSEREQMLKAKADDYLLYAQAEAKNAYLNGKSGLSEDRAARITPLIQQLSPADNDKNDLKMCKDAHNKLFGSPDFGIKNLSFIKAISTKPDWKIVNNEITGNPMYRVKDYIVIAKDDAGKCYAMYNSITQEFAGGWQPARCSFNSEAGGFYLLGDKEELKWGVCYQIECL